LAQTVRLKAKTHSLLFLIQAVNTAAPYICFYTVYYCESHATEGHFQRSLYFKTTAFLWIITSLLTTKTTPFTKTLDDESASLIPAMYAIFITETLKTPITQILDPYGRFQRHFLAPRARNQKELCTYFSGATYYLSERYTDMTNMLFLTFYYATLLPAGFFLAAIALLVHYWTDKYCLLRLWATAPPIGSEIGYITRTYFFTIALVVYAMVSAYNYASFPYDNACESETSVPDDYVGSFQATNGEGQSVLIDIASEEKVYFHCNQDMAEFAFPAVPSNQPQGSEWMALEQQDFANVLFGSTSFGVIAAIFTLWLTKLCAREAASTESFSSPPVKNAYVPQAKLAGDPFPILFCDVSKIDPELMSWEDPNHPDYKIHNTIYACGLENKQVFSTIHHWPPNMN